MPSKQGLRGVLKTSQSAPIQSLILGSVVMSFFTPFAYSANTELRNAELMVRIDSADGCYTISTKGVASPVVRAGVAAEVDDHWIKSSEYPKHEIVDREGDRIVRSP